MDSPLHLAIALEGAGWHPAAWRQADAQPDRLFSAGYWVELAQEAERGMVDFVTIEDALRLPSPSRGRVSGRLDAVLIAARVAPLTEHIGLVPAVTVTHTEPFHISKAIATLDYVSSGRAGVRVQVSGRRYEAANFGRRQLTADGTEDLLGEAADYVEVIRRLWDSWEDDAEIRDVSTGRFVDRDKLHYIDFEGEWFSVKGPSITPRPPQGQPVVTALAHVTQVYRFAVGSADVVYVTPFDTEGARAIVDEVRSEQAEAGRADAPLHVFGDLVVFLDDTTGAARDRLARLDEQSGEAYRSDAKVFTGTAAQLADLLLAWQGAGLSGFRLRPGAIPHDLQAITRSLVPELQHRGAFRRAYDAGEQTLRGRLGLHRPANRYATR